MDRVHSIMIVWYVKRKPYSIGEMGKLGGYISKQNITYSILLKECLLVSQRSHAEVFVFGLTLFFSHYRSFLLFLMLNYALEDGAKLYVPEQVAESTRTRM